MYRFSFLISLRENAKENISEIYLFNLTENKNASKAYKYYTMFVLNSNSKKVRKIK